MFTCYGLVKFVLCSFLLFVILALSVSSVDCNNRKCRKTKIHERTHGPRNLVNNGTSVVSGTTIKRTVEHFNSSTDVRFCNVPDEFPEHLSNVTRPKRYVLYPDRKWDKIRLTWTLRKGSSQSLVTNNMIRHEFNKALLIWSNVSALEFTEVHPDSKNIDIYVDFHVGDHGDNWKFDGRSGTLAHAFYPGPGIGGDVHFDDAEPFVEHHSRGSGKVSLFITAAHELGHSLGIKHSNVKGALMAPFYQDFPSDFMLPTDDMNAIQALYGRPVGAKATIPMPIPTKSTTARRTTPSTTTTYIPPVATELVPPYPKPTRPPKPITRPPATAMSTLTTIKTPEFTTSHSPGEHTCEFSGPAYPGLPNVCDAGFDAATVIRGYAYFFKGSYFWRISLQKSPDANKNFIARPLYVTYLFRNLPPLDKIDAVVTQKNDDVIIFFSGSNYYEIEADKDMSLVNRGTLSDIGIASDKVDAAFIWGHNGYLYVFRNESYWRIGDDLKVETDYPRDISVWRGVLAPITSVVTFRTDTYFFSRKIFWHFSNRLMQVDTPPLLIAPYWLACPHPNKLLRIECQAD